MPIILIKCNKKEADGVTPCLHNDCSGCRIWAEVAEDTGSVVVAGDPGGGKKLSEIPNRPGWDCRFALGEFTEAALADDLSIALSFLLIKFHRETDCGQNGMHWAECDRAIAALGYQSFDALLGE
ncbi:MAG: hypothetical protein M0Z43_04475 [Acidithiobacillus sp.]|nr:hypothetical protein [Acidithiobacillus sp.]